MSDAHTMVVGVVIGAFATLLMDAWLVGVAGRFLGGGKFSVVGMGRWFGSLFHGRLVHADIAASPPLAAETQLGWLLHYGVGIVYGVVLVVLAGPGWVAHPSFWQAWLLGIVTVGAGWFVLQPCLGAGFAASKTPHPNEVRARDLAAHTVFGAGLWVGALLLR